jgi:hypothetical protein
MRRRERQEITRTGLFLRMIGFGGPAAQSLLIRAKSPEVDGLSVRNDTRGKRQPSILHEGKGASVVAKWLVNPGVVVTRRRKRSEARKLRGHARGGVTVVGAEKDYALVIAKRSILGLNATEAGQRKRSTADMVSSTVRTVGVVDEERERSIPAYIPILSLVDEVWTDYERRSRSPVVGGIP